MPGTDNADPLPDPTGADDRIPAELGPGPIYLVDGNNMMGQRPGWWRDRARAQLALRDRICEYAVAETLGIVLFFDGQPRADRRGERGTAAPDAWRGPVLVRFARRGATADDRIVDTVRVAPPDGELVVVTSDRPLTRRVEAHGALVVRTGIFRRRVEETVGPPSFP